MTLTERVPKTRITPNDHLFPNQNGYISTGNPDVEGWAEDKSGVTNPVKDDPLDTADPLAAYVREIGRNPLLRKSQERTLILQIKAGKLVRETRRQLKDGVELTAPKMVETLRDKLQGDIWEAVNSYLGYPSLPMLEKKLDVTREDFNDEEFKKLAREIDLRVAPSNKQQQKEKDSAYMLRDLLLPIRLINLVESNEESLGMEFWMQIEQQSKEAEQKFINGNLRLVVSLAKRYINRGLPLLDLIQQGNLGLMKALEKFDFREGFKFSTYAIWWIKQAISRAIANQARSIRIPVHEYEKIRNMKKIKARLSQTLGRIPTDQELSIYLGEPTNKIAFYEQWFQDTVSLNKPVYTGDYEEELGAFMDESNRLHGEAELTPEEYVIKNELTQKVNEALASLPERQRKVMRLRFGLDDGRSRTLEEVGREFGVTRERIRQIEADALRKLKHPSSAENLSPYW